jgi:uncharacterized membrane protein YdbT with pleckstrin-like domain
VQNLKIPNATNSLVDDSIGLDNVETNAWKIVQAWPIQILIVILIWNLTIVILFWRNYKYCINEITSSLNLTKIINSRDNTSSSKTKKITAIREEEFF